MRHRTINQAYKEAHREQLRAKGRIVVTRDMTCQACGEGFVRTGNRGPIPKWCPDCRKARALEQTHRYVGFIPAAERRCRDCDAVIGLPKRLVCDGCTLSRDHARKVVRRGVESAAVERFNTFEIYERDRWRCGLCGKRVPKNLKAREPMAPSLDHILPISLGGEHTRANVQLAHYFCNLSKGNRSRGEQLRLV